jgi:hypothetical protein
MPIVTPKAWDCGPMREFDGLRLKNIIQPLATTPTTTPSVERSQFRLTLDAGCHSKRVPSDYLDRDEGSFLLPSGVDDPLGAIAGSVHVAGAERKIFDKACHR